MTTRYEIRQKVQTVEKSWLVVVDSSEFERVITGTYHRWVKEHPAEYFELVRVTTDETCLAFTPKLPT